MYGQIQDAGTTLALNRSVKKIGHFFLLLLGGILSGAFLMTFRKMNVKSRFGKIVHLPDELTITHIKSKAVAGDPEEQLRMGVMCAVGVDGWIDHRGALFWFRKAAEQGEPNAQMLIAMMYLEGIGIRRSYMQAARWGRLSALQGNVMAQLLMGALMEDGAGVRRDLERAVYWYQQAAKNPHEIGARQRLGTLYLEGKGVKQDIEEGLKWLNESAEKGDANARFQLGMLYYDGRQVEQNYEKALEWYLKAAEVQIPGKGDGANEVVFGPVAVSGEVYTRTVAQIMKRNPHVIRDAQFYVGLMYETGRGTEQDMAQSRVWYEKAANAGDEIARQRLAFMKDTA